MDINFRKLNVALASAVVFTISPVSTALAALTVKVDDNNVFTVVLGDGNDNVSIVGNDNDSSLQIDDINNGLRMHLENVEGLNIVAKGGDNEITVDGIQLIGDAAGLSIKTGIGVDVVTVTNSIIPGALNIGSGAENDDIFIESVTVAGQTIVKSGKGNDTVYIEELSSAGLVASLADGDDFLQISSAQTDDPGVVTLATSITTGTGVDTVDLQGMLFEGAVSVKTAADGDVVKLTENTFQSTLNVKTGKDDDTVVVSGNVWSDTTEFHGGAGEADRFLDAFDSSGIFTTQAFEQPERVYPFGSTGPNGGTVFHVTDYGRHGLEVTPVDQGQTYWGAYPNENGCTRVESGTQTGLGTGAANTASLLVNCGQGGAAVAATSYGPGWFLPSSAEMVLLAQSNIVNNGQPYWTSSERKPTQPENYAYFVDMGSQRLFTSYKNRTTKFYVRAIAEF